MARPKRISSATNKRSAPVYRKIDSTLTSTNDGSITVRIKH